MIDADVETPGHQPMPLPDTEPQLPPARIVTRVEKQVSQFADVASLWDVVSVASLTPLQRTRIAKALADLDGRIAAMRARLG